jgi:large subunit ribosomal protein L14
MVFPGTTVYAIDNSGALKLKCINILRKLKKSGHVSDIIICSVQTYKQKYKIKKSDIIKSIAVHTNNRTKRPNGIIIRFFKNSIVIINLKNNPIGTRIKGPVTIELKNKKYTKIILLSKYVL